MKVCIIQRVLPHYRIKFFMELREKLIKNDVDLKVIYGQEKPGDVPKTKDVDFEWCRKIQNKYISVLGKELVWQPCLDEVKGADLVIIEQSNRLIVNYLLLGLKRKYRVAFWGHGRNLQGNENSLLERFKKSISTRVDWWFAYTSISRDILISDRFSPDKITLVNNAIDSSELQDIKKDISKTEIDDCRKSLGIETDNVGIYCGGMYPIKNIPFLLECCFRIKKEIPDFEIIFIGGGPDSSLVIEAASSCKWIHYVGEKFGKARVIYFLLSKLQLMPGAVGLAVVDSFVLGVPLFTSDIKGHGPEIAYLDDNVNGVISKNTIENYSASVIRFLSDKNMQKTLKTGCEYKALEITLDNMVERFTGGVLKVLNESHK